MVQIELMLNVAAIFLFIMENMLENMSVIRCDK